MSLGIAFKGPEGIVLAADSRATLTAKRQDGTLLPAFFDNATKLLRVEGQDFVAAVTYGQGAIGQAEPRTANSYLPEFENELKEAGGDRLPVEEFARRLADFYLRQWQAQAMPENADPMTFLVGGYDPEAPYGRVFKVVVPGAVEPVEQSPDGFGATWGGQLQSATRLLNGFDPQVPRIVAEVAGLDDAQQEELRSQLKQRLGLPIPYQFLPLQDSIDLSILLVRTTAQLQTFLVDIRGVGGHIDVATITRTEGFRAVQVKEITGERVSH